MSKISEEIVRFFYDQGCVIVSTIDENGFPSSSCKGIVEIDHDGHVYLLDLYRGRTWSHLQKNPHICITAIDEHRFTGYSLKGKARIVTNEEFKPHLLKAWEDRIASRLTKRVLKNLRGEKGHAAHPEALMPEPEYLIAMDVEEVIDLAPRHSK